MEKIPFNPKFRPQIESGEYRVETRCGYPVQIVCWNLRDTKHEDDTHKRTILGLIDCGDGTFGYEVFNSEGLYMPIAQSNMDLFVVTENVQLTKFESRLCEILDYSMRHPEDSPDAIISVVKQKLAPQLMDLARKEIKTDGPKWRMAKAGTRFDNDAVIVGIGDDKDPRLVRCAVNDCWYILVKDLVEKLTSELSL